MRKLTYQAILENPELLHEIEHAARRERVIAVRELVERLFAAFTRREPRRAAGPHLAH